MAWAQTLADEGDECATSALPPLAERTQTGLRACYQRSPASFWSLTLIGLALLISPSPRWVWSVLKVVGWWISGGRW
jgi:hypothetical protein